MTRRDCPRLWEAEAIEDGRLQGKEQASFERHSATCASCSNATDTLACLRALAEQLPGPEPLGELEQRRQRAALLRRANEIALTPAPRPRSRVVGLAAALVAAGAVAATTVTLHRAAPVAAPRESAPLVVSPPVYAVSPLPGSTWHTVDAGPSARLALESGTLSVHVAKLTPHQRFVIALPDGELEVRGTRFTVLVAGGRTRHVVVTEGRVALRLRGEPERLISAGESWGTEPAPAAPPPVAVAAPAAPRVESPATPHVVARAARAIVAPPGSAAAPAVDTAATDLSAAMRAFNAGDYARAEQLFAAFQQRHPGDARCEDAAYLRSVARARAGDAKGAADLARAYLDRYPSGLRRDEAERIAK